MSWWRLGLPLESRASRPPPSRRLRSSRSRRLRSRAFFSSSVRGLSAREESELRRGRGGTARRGGELGPSPLGRCRRARKASSCDRLGLCGGGGPRLPDGGMFSPPGRFIGGGRAGGTFFLSLSPIVRPACKGRECVSRVKEERWVGFAVRCNASTQGKTKYGASAGAVMIYRRDGAWCGVVCSV